MKLCPYCGKEIVSNALACKHCGQWLEDISDYLEEKGSIYAHSDSIELIQKNEEDIVPAQILRKSETISKPFEIECVFCRYPAIINKEEIENKKFFCKNCGKKNLISDGSIKDVLKNIPIGWGWLILTAYFTFSIQKYLNTLDDLLQSTITFALSVIVLLLIYFSFRRYLLKNKYEKHKSFGSYYNVSLVAGSVSILGVVTFIFIFHLAYSFSGLQSDKNETNLKVNYFRTKINHISEKQKEINSFVENPENNSANKIQLLDEYIELNKQEKLYVDSLFKAFGESEYYTNIGDNKIKIKKANILMNKIITYKILSARNLKYYLSTGNKNYLKSVSELNSEIAKFSDEYSKNYQNLKLEE